jgi:pimeloyl-ACP methyl ester carboxylesterase
MPIEFQTANLHHVAKYQTHKSFTTIGQHYEKEDITSIPKWWVSGAKDIMFPLELVEKFIAQGGFDRHDRLENADHTPHLSNTGALVKVLVAMAETV